jgi:hypothetical protein
MRILQDNLLEPSRQEFEAMHAAWKASLPTKEEYQKTFGITEQKSAQLRRLYLRNKLNEAINHKNRLLSSIAKYPKDGWLFKDDLSEVDKEIARTTASLSFNGAYARFDVQALKQVSIDKIVSVNPAGFFKARPDEKTASAKWYRDNNTWVDFGGDNRKHSVIDLVMILQDCDFYHACRYLSEL